jgi:outer membrane biosynthesis protein TonB
MFPVWFLESETIATNKGEFMVSRIILLLTLALGLFFTQSVSKRPDRQCVKEFAARHQAENMVLPDYPADAEPVGLQGLVLATVLFDQEGKMAKVRVDQTPGPQFAGAITRALEQWKLKILYNAGGEPIETQTGVRFHFIFENGKGRVEAATDDEQKEVRGEWVQKVCKTRL